MYFDFKVKIPEEKGKIFERTIKGVTYINYEYDRVYKPDKKYNIPKRTTIGKKCDDDTTMMYPNPNFLTYFPDAELPVDEGRDNRSSCHVPAAIRELEKIEMIRQADGIYRLDHALTANQKTILKAFDIDANYVKGKTKQISDDLNPKMLKVKINGRNS